MDRKIMYFLVFLLSCFAVSLFAFSDTVHAKVVTSDEYKHKSFSSTKCTIKLMGPGSSLYGDPAYDSHPSYQSDPITQTYEHRKRYDYYTWEKLTRQVCKGSGDEKECKDEEYYDWVYDRTEYSSWVTKTTTNRCSEDQKPKATPDPYVGNMGSRGNWEHFTKMVDPGGWYGGPPRIASSEELRGYSTWVVAVTKLEIPKGNAGEWTYEYQPPAMPECTKLYGNNVEMECGHHGRNPGFYGQIVEGGLDKTFVKIFYYYLDPYTKVTENTNPHTGQAAKGIRLGSVSDNYTTRWWLKDVAIEGSDKFAGLDVAGFKYPKEHWDAYAGTQKDNKCYAYFYKDPRDTPPQIRIDITDGTYIHSWRTGKVGVQGPFRADAAKPPEPDSYFDRDTRWVGNGRYEVPYKNPRADNSGQYWRWQDEPSRVLQPASGVVYNENDRENEQREHHLINKAGQKNRGVLYPFDLLYDGTTKLNCDADMRWYYSQDIPYLIPRMNAYRDLQKNAGAPFHIRHDEQTISIKKVEKIELLLSGNFYKHTDRDEAGTDEMIQLKRKVIEDPQPGVIPEELKDLYFLKGRFYTFEIRATYSDGKTAILNSIPEAHWTIQKWIKDQPNYKKNTSDIKESYRTMMPYNGIEHQIAHNGKHDVKFEWFDKVNSAYGKTKLGFQIQAAEITSLDIYNEEDELGPTKLNTGDTHQFKAIMAFDAGDNKKFEYDWTNDVHWGVDSHTVKMQNPGKFLFPKGVSVYDEHVRAGSDEERAERVIYAFWFNDIIQEIELAGSTNHRTNGQKSVDVYEVIDDLPYLDPEAYEGVEAGKLQHFDAFSDMHVVQLKDGCVNGSYQIYVDKCPVPDNWRTNLDEPTNTYNFIPNIRGDYYGNPYFMKFQFPVTGASNGVGKQ